MNSKMAWELFKKWALFTSLLGLGWFGGLMCLVNPTEMASMPWFINTITPLNFLAGVIFLAVIFFVLSRSEKCLKIWGYQEVAIISSLALGGTLTLVTVFLPKINMVMVVTFLFATLSLFVIDISWTELDKKHLLIEIDDLKYHLERYNINPGMYGQSEVKDNKEKIKAGEEKLGCEEEDKLIKYVLASILFSLPSVPFLGILAGLLILFELLLIRVIVHLVQYLWYAMTCLMEEIFCVIIPTVAKDIWNSSPVTSLRIWLTTVKEE